MPASITHSSFAQSTRSISGRKKKQLVFQAFIALGEEGAQKGRQWPFWAKLVTVLWQSVCSCIASGPFHLIQDYIITINNNAINHAFAHSNAPAQVPEGSALALALSRTLRLQLGISELLSGPGPKLAKPQLLLRISGQLSTGRLPTIGGNSNGSNQGCIFDTRYFVAISSDFKRPTTSVAAQIMGSISFKTLLSSGARKCLKSFASCCSHHFHIWLPKRPLDLLTDVGSYGFMAWPKIWSTVTRPPNMMTA